MIPVHELPTDKLFRVYLADGVTTRSVLWFRCSNNGDLITRSLSKSSNVLEVHGNFDADSFRPTSTPKKLRGLTGNDEFDHKHFTFHPSSLKKPKPILFGLKRRSFVPKFDLRTIDGLEQVAIHLLASPNQYPIRRPRPDKPDEKYHAMLANIYGHDQPRITFWVAPINRETSKLAEACVVKDCQCYVRMSPMALDHDLLLQIRVDATPYTEYGDIHILMAPIVTN